MSYIASTADHKIAEPIHKLYNLSISNNTDTKNEPLKNQDHQN
jgi:hypothetical protein